LEIAAGLLLAAAIPLWLSPGPWYAAGAGVARVVLACVAIGLASLCAYGCKGRFASALAWKPLRWLGYVSYSFYLAHSLGLFALLVVVRWAWPSLQPAFWLAAALAPLAFAAALAPSLLLFSAVEYRFVRPAALSASR
jgi:peptidoglycan/LPS O-acetylase OafA/YrhL